MTLLRRLLLEEYGWGKVWTGLGMAIALAGGGLVYQQVTAGGGTEGVDVWMSPTGNDGTCARGNQSLPCETFNGAIAVAQTGDEIELAGAATPGGTGGWYECDTLVNQSKTLTFVAATGEYPWVACNPSLTGTQTAGYALLFNNVDNVTLKDIYLTGIDFWNGSSNITLENVHVTCENDATHFELFTSDLCAAKLEAHEVNDLNDFTMTGGEIGPTVDNEPGTDPGAGRMSANNMVFDGVEFHDNINIGGHSECIFIRGGDPITFRNNRFINCDVFGIFISCYPANGACSYGNPPDNVLIENNFFGPGPQYYSVQVNDTNPALTVDYRYNTFYKPVDFAGGVSSGEFVGNIAAYDANCPGSYTFSYNVFGDDAGGYCAGTGNQSVMSTAYTSDGAGYNTTTGVLNAGSVAIGAGDPADYPATDYEGDTRSSPPDAGWDERP